MNCPDPTLTIPDLLEKALTVAANAAFITDRDGCIVWVNDAFCRASGYSAQESVGRTPSFLKSGRQDPAFYRALWQTILAGDMWRGEVVERRKDGSLYAVDQTITPIRDDTGSVTHFLAIQNDITERKRQTERDHYLAYHDDLTNLPNRALFMGVLQHAINHARQSGRSLALLFLDLDGFKPINDTLGHPIGDRLLIAVSERLSAAVRKSDTVARVGGDEFAIIQTDLQDAGIAASLADKLLQSLAQPFRVDGQRVRTTASIGIAVFPADGDKPEELLMKADKAMYGAKHRGRNQYTFYNPVFSEMPHTV